ncbi:MAG: aconitase X [Actinobacteria bacterium]|nr:aconitase X [Actinomycetota bacterium]
MRLTEDEERMLAGGYGEGYRRAIEILVSLGEFYDAERLVPVSMAYLVEGPSPSEPGQATKWLEDMADLGTTFRCPLSTAPLEGGTFTDYGVHKRLGTVFAASGGGHPRNPFVMPVYGQHITAGGTAVTHYMNSYIGARSNTEDFLGQYSAAIVGKTPEYGFHLSEKRVGKTLFDIKVGLRDETDWSALGYYISRTLAKNYWDVPVINGISPADVTNDDLVAFSMSVPSYGAVVHTLLVGVSPEGRTLEQAFAGGKPKETYVVGPKELTQVFDTFSTANERPDMVCFGGFGVNLSISAVYQIARLLEGKKVSGDFPTVAMIDGPVRTVADMTGITDILKKAGVNLGMPEVFAERGLEASAWSQNAVISAKRMGWNTLVFADAKSCHYIGNQNIEPVLKHVDECVQIALTGRIEG